MSTLQHILYKGCRLHRLLCVSVELNAIHSQNDQHTHANSQSTASNLVITNCTFVGIVDISVMWVEMNDMIINK